MKRKITKPNRADVEAAATASSVPRNCGTKSMDGSDEVEVSTGPGVTRKRKEVASAENQPENPATKYVLNQDLITRELTHRAFVAFRVGNVDVTGAKRAKTSQRSGIRPGWTPTSTRSDSNAIATPVNGPENSANSASAQKTSIDLVPGPPGITFGGYIADSDDESTKPDTLDPSDLAFEFEFVDPFGPPQNSKGATSAKVITQGTERDTQDVSYCHLFLTFIKFIKISMITITSRALWPSSSRGRPSLLQAIRPLAKTPTPSRRLGSPSLRPNPRRPRLTMTSPSPHSTSLVGRISSSLPWLKWLDGNPQEGLL